MRVTQVSDKVSVFRADFKVHRDYLPAQKTRQIVTADYCKKNAETVMILNTEGVIVGRYGKNRFGNTQGFIFVNTDLEKAQEFIDIMKNVKMEDMFNSLVKRNLRQKKPLEGYLLIFQQFKTLLNDIEKTGISVFSLKNGNRVAHRTTKGYRIPSLEEAENLVEYSICKNA